MPTALNNPNMSRGQSGLSTPRTPASRQSRGPQSRGTDLGQLKDLPTTVGASQKRPPPKKSVPMLGVPDKPKVTLAFPNGNQSPGEQDPADQSDPNFKNDEKPGSAKIEITLPTANEENRDNEKNKGNDGNYSDDFESDNENHDDIESFKYNEIDFKKRMRALSASSNLDTDFSMDKYEKGMTLQKEQMAERQSYHEDWVTSFRQKKSNIMSRLGVILKDRSNRFHNMCGIAQDQHRDALTRVEDMSKRLANRETTFDRITPSIDSVDFVEENTEWPEIVDLGEKYKQEQGLE